MAAPGIFRLARWILAAWVVLTGIAMRLYPGGTVRNPSASGYSFFQNFMSDLGCTVALGGHSNRLGAFLFVMSSGLMALALLGCFAALVRLSVLIIVVSYQNYQADRIAAEMGGASV